MRWVGPWESEIRINIQQLIFKEAFWKKSSVKEWSFSVDLTVVNFVPKIQILLIIIHYEPVCLSKIAEYVFIMHDIATA